MSSVIDNMPAKILAKRGLDRSITFFHAGAVEHFATRDLVP